MRQHRHPVLGALTIADDEGSPFKLQVFDAQAQAFHQSHAAAVDQLGHQLMRARQATDEAQRLLFGQDGGQAPGAFGAQGRPPTRDPGGGPRGRGTGRR